MAFWIILGWEVVYGFVGVFVGKFLRNRCIEFVLEFSGILEILFWLRSFGFFDPLMKQDLVLAILFFDVD